MSPWHTQEFEFSGKHMVRFSVPCESRSFNRKIGNRHDDLMAALAGVPKTTQAIRVSLRWGTYCMRHNYGGRPQWMPKQEAAVLVARGLKKIGMAMRA